MAKRTCSIDGCEKPVVGWGWCERHYRAWARTGDPTQGLRPAYRDTTPEMRFWAKVDKRGPDDCWLWTGWVDPQGYGRFLFDGRVQGAHRFAYLRFVGPIPDGKVLDHACHTWDATCLDLGSGCPHRRCVNPRHLQPVTQRENLLRGNNSRVRITHCIRGHEYTPENTRLRFPPNEPPSRACKACEKIRSKQKWQEELRKRRAE